MNRIAVLGASTAFVLSLLVAGSAMAQLSSSSGSLSSSSSSSSLRARGAQAFSHAQSGAIGGATGGSSSHLISGLSSTRVSSPKLAPLHTESSPVASGFSSSSSLGGPGGTVSAVSSVSTAAESSAFARATGNENIPAQYSLNQIQSMRATDRARATATESSLHPTSSELHEDYLDRQQQTQLSSLQSRTALGSGNAGYFPYPYYRYQRVTGYGRTNRAGASVLTQAVSLGCRQGFASGVSDRGERMPFNYAKSPEYQNSSYSGVIVPRNDFNYYFRKGYRRCYRDAYYRRGTLNTMLNSVLENVLRLQPVR